MGECESESEIIVTRSAFCSEIELISCFFVCFSVSFVCDHIVYNRHKCRQFDAILSLKYRDDYTSYTTTYSFSHSAIDTEFYMRGPYLVVLSQLIKNVAMKKINIFVRVWPINRNFRVIYLKSINEIY